MKGSSIPRIRPQVISIIGSGFTGTAVGKGLQSLGYSVIFYDIQHKDLPNFTQDLHEAIRNSSVSIICIPTPTRVSGDIDLSHLESGVASIGSELRHKNEYHLLAVKSTIMPTTTETILIPILEKASGKKAGVDFGICVNPEFMTQLSTSWSDDESFARTFFNEDRIVIGEHDSRAGSLLEEIYKPLRARIWRVDMKTAEMIKCASNCMLATKISYWNEIFLICNSMGIDAQKVANVVATDHRIGKYGTVLGKAFGGRCLPKDLDGFISIARRYQQLVLLESVRAINERMRQNYGVRE